MKIVDNALFSNILFGCIASFFDVYNPDVVGKKF